MKQKLFFSFIFLLICSVDVVAQDVPYLQAPNDTSIVVTWITSTGTESTVEYGTTESDLDLVDEGTTSSLSGSHHVHQVRLDGLTPNSYYYYRTKTGGTYSDTYRFKTQPARGTSTGKVRFIIIGDHQRSDEEYRHLVDDAAAKALEKWGGSNVEEVVNFVMNNGDQVNTGGNLTHYRVNHFRKSGGLCKNVPFVGVPGNHEYYGDSDLSNYFAHFAYDHLNYAGIVPDDPAHAEHYYAFQIGNAVFLMMDSNQSWPSQTNFVNNVKTTANADGNIDWLFGTAHHPISAEQLPGDASPHMRNTLLPALASSDKMTMYISGHAHIYSRGALREESVYNIINGGASWDQFWNGGEIDYPDIQKTIERHIFQLVELDLGERTMTVETYTNGNIYKSEPVNLIDTYSRIIDRPKPNKPNVGAIDVPVMLPYTIVSSSYSGAEPYNSTEFQIDLQENDFSSPVITEKRDFENVFGSTGFPDYTPIDINEGVNIFELNLEEGALLNGMYKVRVRHRDQNLEWSDWSDHVNFEVTGSGTTSIHPIAYFPFNGSVFDESVNGKDFDEGVDSGVSFVTDAERGAVIDLDNTHSIVIQEGEGSHDGLPKREMTVSAWVKVREADTWGGFVGNMFDTGSDETGWELGTRGQKFSFALASDGNTSLTYLQDSENFVLNQWYHLAATYDGETMRLYVDGEQKVIATSNSGDIEYRPSGWFTIGSYKDNNEDNRHDGRLDEVTIWERALTSAEITDVYTDGVDAGVANDHVIVNYLLNGNALDQSNYAKHGVESGITYEPGVMTGEVGSFGNTGFIDVQTGENAAQDLPLTNFTVATWVKTDEADTYGGFIGCIQDNGSYEKGWVLGTRGTKFSFALRTDGASSMTYLTDPDNFVLGEWYYVVATYDGTTTRLYVNGEEKSSTTAQNGFVEYPPSSWFTIGRYKDNNEDFRHDGELDNVLVLSKVLGKDDITGLYLKDFIVGDYKFENNVNDASFFEKDGINEGVTFVTDDSRGTVGEFDNTAYIDVQTGENASQDLPLTNFTVATWVKTDEADTYGGFVGCIQDNGSYEKGWVLGTRGTKFSFALRTSGASSMTYLTDPDNFVLGEWYYVVATYDGTTTRLYVNGEEKSSTTAQNGFVEYPPSSWYTIGRYKDNNEDFRHDGELDNVLVLSKVLDKDEITGLYFRDYVVGDYRFENNVNDESSFEKDGINEGVTFVTDDSRGTVGEFDNTAYIDVQTGENASQDLPLTNFTVATWVKTNEADTYGGFVGCIQDNGSYEKGWVLGTRGTKFSFALRTSGASSMTYLTAPDNFVLGEWYYVVATYDGTTTRLYVNGEEKSSTTAQNGFVEYPPSSWYTIGRYKDNNEDFRHDGELDNVLVLSKVLDENEITSLYLSDYVVGDYRFENNVNDASFFEKDGVNQGVTFVTDDSRGIVGKFDNTAYIDVQTGSGADQDLPTTELTVSVFAKFESTDTWGGIVGYMQDNGSYEKGWVLGTRKNKLSIALKSEGAGSMTYLTSPDNLVLNRWYHIGATYDGETLKLYVDGEEKASTTAQSGEIDYPGSGWYTIGRYKDNNEDFRHEGQLDNVLIISKALTASDISNLSEGAESDLEYRALVLGDEPNPVISKPEINVYPNPSAGVFQVDIPKEMDVYDFTVFNIAGEEVMNGAGAPEMIDLTNEPKSVYYLLIRLKDDNTTLGYKLFKQ